MGWEHLESEKNKENTGFCEDTAVGPNIFCMEELPSGLACWSSWEPQANVVGEQKPRHSTFPRVYSVRHLSQPCICSILTPRITEHELSLHIHTLTPGRDLLGSIVPCRAQAGHCPFTFPAHNLLQRPAVPSLSVLGCLWDGVDTDWPSNPSAPSSPIVSSLVLLISALLVTGISDGMLHVLKEWMLLLAAN